MTSSTSTPTSNSHPAVNPSEVGWQFVPQYYTFVNKEPHRLHCFYNKNSTFIHGTEGEDGKPCYGQQEIHKKITSIGFEDCKVFIHSVDAQSSANGGIIIQVIGEMSNKNEAWRKFVQTFFLAEQPNGYFVLNDVFRFLKEESVEEDAHEEEVDVSEPDHAAPVAPVEQPLTPTPSIPEPVFEPPREPTPPPAPTPAEPAPVEPAPVDEAPTNDVTEPVVTQTNTPPPEEAAPAVNGIHTPEPEKASPAPAAPAVLAETPAPAPPVPQPAPVAQPPAAAPAPAVQAPAVSAAPAAPRSWASLAANNSKKWGSAVAQESRGTTETLSAPSSGAQTPVTSAPAAPAQRPVQGGPRGAAGHDHPLYIAAQSVTTAHCFVKGVVETISEPALRSALSRFGNIKEMEVVRTKACAFIEYERVDSAKRAITASLGHNQGGDGGVFIDTGDARLKISVETKKERGDRPPANRRGGAPAVNGEGGGRGGSNFRGGPRGGRGRGAPAAK